VKAVFIRHTHNRARDFCTLVERLKSSEQERSSVIALSNRQVVMDKSPTSYPKFILSPFAGLVTILVCILSQD